MNTIGFCLPATIIRVISFVLATLLASCGGGETPSDRIQSSQANSHQTHSPALPSVKAQAAVVKPQTSVVAFVKVGEVRVSRTVFDYAFRVTFQNGEVPRSALMATVVDAGKGTAIVDGSVLIGDLATGASFTPSDIIVLRVDRSSPFDPQTLAWVFSEPINGFPVPPEPDELKNGSTIAGIDSNGNGVRDDAERKLASLVSTQADLLAGLRYLRAFQSIFVEPPPPTRSAALLRISKVICALDVASPTARALSARDLLVTTPARKAALTAFFDVLVGYSAGELPNCVL